MRSKGQKSKVESRKSGGSKKAPSHESRVPNPESLPLLVEIGCEEIPARFLSSAQSDFGASLAKALREARLVASEAPDTVVQTYSTPRRLVAHALAVLDRQPDKMDDITGPPAKVVWDAEGKPTKAAQSFAQKNAVAVEDLVRITTPKGEYAAVRKTTKGLPAAQILSELLPSVILGLSFPKSMYWLAKAGPRFIRPIRWVLALLGEGKQAKVVSFRVAGVKASDRTFGHRALGRRPISVAGFEDFRTKLFQNHVEIDPSARREKIRTRLKAVLEEFHRELTGDPNWTGGEFQLRAVRDDSLEDWVINSTEWPTPQMGRFDDLFQAVPREVLITVMRDHQKYFAVENEHGVLQSRFVSVLNVESDSKGLIRAGHERVLQARFADALFFWNSDQKTLLRDRQQALEGVTYQAQLGSYAEKVRRMKNVAHEICALLEDQLVGFGDEQRQQVVRALELAKCDLTTQMVGEFPELQGVVGGLYARAQGEPEAVAQAIYDHYQPQSMEDPCPRSIIGAVVSLADKLDSVASGFAVGLEPTGSSDPFALRRAGNGAIKVFVEVALPISLRALVEKAINSLNVKWARPQVEVFASVVAFLEERLKYYLESVRSMRYDTVRAVLAAGLDVPVDAVRRAEALEKIRDSADFEALFVAAKRIKNILAKSAGEKDWEPGEVDPALLAAEEEKALAKAFGEVVETVENHRQEAHYEQALKSIAKLRQPVDRFFDKVLVMAEDANLRRNRLRLLGKLDELFSSVASFSEIAPSNVVAPTKVKAVNEK